MTYQVSGIPDEEIRAQTDRLCLSERFRQSTILCAFLRYVVEQTLLGKQHEIKEYSIALGVLNKKSDFNPQLDAIVRIHAGRLRKILSSYYAGPGAPDPIVITIPTGSYVPDFKRKSEAAGLMPVIRDTPTIHKNKPVLAVLPFRVIPPNKRIDVLAHVLTSDLGVELTRFNELSIISGFSVLQASAKVEGLDEIAKHLGADCLIDGSVLKIGDKLKITVGIHLAAESAKLWANSFEVVDDETSAFKEIAYIIRKVTGVITGHFGILYRYMLNSPTASITKDYSYAYAIYQVNKYHLKFTQASIKEAIEALHTALEQHPDNALLANTLGNAYLNLRTTDFHGDFDPIEKGLYYTNIALRLDPNLPYNYRNLAWAMVLQHDREGYSKMITKAIDINPNNVFILGDAGFGFCCVGDYEKGLDYLLEAVHLDPYYPWYFNVGFCLYYLNQKDFREASYYAQLISHPDYFIDPLLQAATLGWLEKKNEAAPHIHKLLDLISDFDDRADEILGLYILDVSLQALLLEGLQKAGWGRKQESKTKIRSIASHK